MSALRARLASFGPALKRRLTSRWKDRPALVITISAICIFILVVGPYFLYYLAQSEGGVAVAQGGGGGGEKRPANEAFSEIDWKNTIIRVRLYNTSPLCLSHTRTLLSFFFLTPRLSLSLAESRLRLTAFF